MPKPNESDRKKDTHPASSRQDNSSTKLPHGRPGGHTDSATGGKPGGGGTLHNAKRER